MITITINKSDSTVIINTENQVHIEFHDVKQLDMFISMLQCIFNNFNFVDGDMVKLEVKN